MTEPAPLYQTLPANRTTFGGHPVALRTLFLTEMWERFSYYGMRALLILYMVAPEANSGLGFDVKKSAAIYGWYTSLVYLTSLPGGYLADTFLGQRTSVVLGGIIIAAGHFCLALPSLGFFYLGLLLIVLGTGLLKPNVSTLVGGLYAPGDARRDGAFSIFYMGINLGATIAPFVCGYLAQNDSFLAFLAAHGLSAHLGWHFGFGAAGLGMTFGVIQFVMGLRDFGKVGEEPANSFSRKEPIVHGYTNSRGPAPLTRDDWTRIAAVGIFFVFATIFWAAYEQAGSSLNLFADQLTDNRILGWAYPSSWLQSVNSIFIIALSPVFGWLWIKLGSRQPSSPAKFAIALFFVAVSFFIVAGGAKVAVGEHVKVSPWWLIGVYFFSTLGELCLSPVGLSITTKLAPERYASLMMGVWFLSLSAGNKLGGFVAGFFDPNGSLPWLFLIVAFTALGAALLLAALIKPVHKLMAGVD